MTIAARETGSTLAIRDDQHYWTEPQRAGLAQLGLADAPPGDLAIFFHQCQRTGLDPFAKQIYLIGRDENVKTERGWEKRTKYTIQTGIDGFRLVGRRAADAARHAIGLSPVEWCGEDGRWRDVWLSAEHPAAARVTVYRDGQPFPAVALWSEYASYTGRDDARRLTRMWAERGAGQLAKCAEALAWRKAFPHDLSGLYTTDEMAHGNQADHPADEPTPVRPAIAQTTSIADALDSINEADLEVTPMASRDQQTAIATELTRHNIKGKAAILAWCSQQLDRELESGDDLTADEADRLITAAAEATVGQWGA